MRIATWNVNSLKARQEKVDQWLARAAPDILLIQETKLTDADAPVMPFAMAGYDLLHHGEGRWNGVAIATRQGLQVDDVVTNFGDGPVRDSGPGATSDFSEEDFNPFDEARMLSARIDGLRVVTVYGPNGRVVGSPFYAGKLAWYERLERWLKEARDPAEPLLVGGDFNIAPTDDDVWDARAVHGGTHVSEPEREAFRRLLAWGLTDAYRLRQSGGRTLQLVGLPGGQLPQEPRHADRPSPGHKARRRAGRRRRDRSRGAQGAADPVRPRPGLDRPGRAGQGVRRRLGGCPRADRRAVAATGAQVALIPTGLSGRLRSSAPSPRGRSAS